MPTQDQVVEAFKTLAGPVERPMAVKLRVRQQTGCQDDEADTALDAAVANGALVVRPTGGLALP